MKTPDVIKMGLECCIEGECSKCPYEQVCDKHLADGGDVIPAAEPLADFLALIQQLERERDAAVEDMNLAAQPEEYYCAICKYRGDKCEHRRSEAPVCWQWRGVQEVE